MAGETEEGHGQGQTEDFPICPHCLIPLRAVGCYRHPAGFSIYFCNECKKVLGITDTQAFTPGSGGFIGGTN